ncbi:lysozyme (plasmid) [Arsenophonus nasoniae]|nr:lysozyme [Arsenophonus nasoniae]WGM18554.1 lysozyme [Arsenophonus nasoniae]
MNNELKKRLMLASAGGVVAISSVLVQWHEGLRYYPYKDNGGVVTVCYGHTGKDVIAGKRYTEEECQKLLDADLRNAIDTVESSVKVPLSTIQKAALASFVYNVGNTAFANSTLLKKLNAGDIQGACNEMHRWKYDDGKVSKGLINRRKVEQELCQNKIQ